MIEILYLNPDPNYPRRGQWVKYYAAYGQPTRREFEIMKFRFTNTGNEYLKWSKEFEKELMWHNLLNK